MSVAQVADREFGKVVLRSDKPTLVAFRASWCMPSQDLVPIIDELAKSYGNRVQFVAVDTDGKTSAISRRYRVNRIPVTMLFDQGRRVDAIGGMTTREAIAEMLDRRLAPVRNVGEFDFDNEVLDAKVPVLVHFDAAWCRPSQELVPVLDQVASKFQGVAKVVRVDFGPDTARLCARWGVQRVPTLALFVEGEIQDQILGGLAGGTKDRGAAQSCVGLTTFDTIERLLNQAVL